MSGHSYPDAAPGSEPDPSMDDILASIRRILSEDEAPQAKPEPEPPVLMLNPAMMVQEPEPMTLPPPAAAPAAASVAAATVPVEIPVSSHARVASAPALALNPDLLVDGATQAATASSVGNLVRTLVSARGTVIHRSGPTLEDMVRDEMRPWLKEWLDSNLPALVERLVQAEIERVIKASA